jgi:hypothetical protein
MTGGADHGRHGFILEVPTDPATTSRSRQPKTIEHPLTCDQDIPIPTGNEMDPNKHESHRFPG